MTPPDLPVAPEAVGRMSPAQLDALLDRLETTVPAHPPLVTLGTRPGAEALVFGDTHGDWLCTRSITGRFANGSPETVLVGLGDYIDRAPGGLAGGSAANVLHLLSLAAVHPDRVFLLLGNHELVRKLGASPHTLPEEMRRRWGEDPRRYDRLMALIERGPLIGRTASGALLAHAGFPRGEPANLEDRRLDPTDEQLLLEVTWPEPDAAEEQRGAALPWGFRDLDRFLAANDLRVFLRGHDPPLTGRSLYGGRCLTLHSCRLYRRYGGIVMARLPLDGPVRGVGDLVIEPVEPDVAHAEQGGGSEPSV